MTKIDWTKPLADTADGRAVVYAGHLDHDSYARVRFGDDPYAWCYNDYGKPAAIVDEETPVIRNVIEQPTTDPLVERMKALVGKMVQVSSMDYAEAINALFDEAHAIQGEISPVDPDMLEARRIAAESVEGHTHTHGNPAGYLLGTYDDQPGMVAMLKAIKRGRELANSETGHD